MSDTKTVRALIDQLAADLQQRECVGAVTVSVSALDEFSAGWAGMNPRALAGAARVLCVAAADELRACRCGADHSHDVQRLVLAAHILAGGGSVLVPITPAEPRVLN